MSWLTNVRLWALGGGALLLLLAAPSDALAQTTVRGTVTDADGQPVAGAEVLIPTLNILTTSGEGGSYRLLVPAARLVGRMTVEMTARRIGLRAQTVVVTLQPNVEVMQDFTLPVDPFLLEAVLVTGQGLREERTKIGATISTVRGEDITASREVNLVAAIAGKAPNVEVSSSTGDPGGGAYIRIRGAKSIAGGTQPLIVVDGQPISNSSTTIETNLAGVAYQNRAADINPDDIESVEILKGAAAAGIYGSRATNGVVLITTKSGERNATRWSFKTSVGIDRVNQLQELQTGFSQGQDLAVPSVGSTGVLNSSQSWGPAIAGGTPVYDHAGEMFETGIRTDNTASLSGGTDRTTYYLSVGYLRQDGTIKGNSLYERITARLKGTHEFLDNLVVGGNFSYTTSNGDLVQQGSNISGMLLGAFRTPPEFNNVPYIDPVTGFHRSYRCETGVQGAACPTTLSASRGYDNPFWVANEILNTADVDRAIGNVSIDYAPFPWLTFRWIGGIDFANDQRLTLFPKSSSDFPDGRLIRAELVDKVFDHTLLGTVEHAFSPDIAMSVSVGQNLNQTEFRRFQVNGQNLIFGTGQLDFSIDRIPNEFTSKVRTEGYFAELSLDLYDQVYLKGGVRFDGSNTFGGDIDPVTGDRESSRFWYPKASAVWEFSRYVDFLDFAKLRFAYGQAGRQPPIYSNVSAFGTGTFTDGWLNPNGLNSIYQGFEGVFSQTVLGNTLIEPEKTTEIEMGTDLAFLDNRVSLGVTYYRDKTTNAILNLPVTPSTGYFSKSANGAEWRNWGWELILDLLPVQQSNFAWRLGGQWAKNNSMVDELLGAEQVYLAGFTEPSANVVEGQPFGVLFGLDFIRFGRGSTVGGVDIDNAFSGWQEGDLYINASGFPELDPQDRVVGDPNPDWTASIRNTFTLYKKLRVSALVDIKQGGDIWNGTKGALFFFGTHKGTERMHGAGLDTVFATCATCGPGAGTQVTLDWNNWTVGGIGSGFTGPSSQFIEDGSFVKLRDVSVSFTLDGSWLNRIGFDALDISVSGRNLVTWTDYTGLDPEANLTGQSTGRGLEYFNHPQTRSFVFTFTLHR